MPRIRHQASAHRLIVAASIRSSRRPESYRAICRRFALGVFSAALVASCVPANDPPPRDQVFVFETSTSIGVARGATVMADVRAASTGAWAPVRVTTDRRYAYTYSDAGITFIDTRTFVQRVLPCEQTCLGFPTAVNPIGRSLVGGFDAGSDPDGPESAQTWNATVRGIDLGSAVPHVQTIGSVPLLAAQPAEHNVLPYTFYLDSADGVYAFLNAVNYRPTRAWELPQTLWIATLNGRARAVGDYAFPSERDVWGAMRPDGKVLAIGHHSLADVKGMRSCQPEGVDLIDTVSGTKTTVSPPGSAEKASQSWISRAWWGADSTLYVTYQRRGCSESGTPAPQVWALRSGTWHQVVAGPAIFAVELGGGAVAVVEPASINSGRTDTVDMTKGPLYYVDPAGARTKIAEDVTGVADVPRPDIYGVGVAATG